MSEKTPDRNPYTNKKINLHGPTHKELYNANPPIMDKKGRLTLKGREIKEEYERTRARMKNPFGLGNSPTNVSKSSYIKKTQTQEESPNIQRQTLKDSNMTSKSGLHKANYEIFLKLIEEDALDNYFYLYDLYDSEGNLDINNTNDNGDSILISAVKENDIDITEMLIMNGADLEKVDNLDFTALSIATNNHDTDMVKLLLEKGANVNHQGNKDLTPLMIAVLNGDERMIKILLKYQPDLNLEDEDGLTADMLALENGHIQLARSLRKHLCFC
jgi:ankyrin repeat protein